MKKTIFVFSALILALLALFQVSKYSYARGNASIEAIIAVVAVVFLFIGLYINKSRSKKVVTPTNRAVNHGKIEELGLSKREYEVLLEISKGLSNKEIGEKLFVTESTIKTHVSNILVKLDVKRRTQALQKAKELQIIPV
ncbi:response regulator transcription factor [Flavobacteriaceae bacterium TP-CH-4]|uniref:Response regulator transcription factor n=1 Tax=Pelagihabitans pacificus TaxID=2696054 RepID=A0A967AZZ4_9FLAO|nr:response regulator transcription factor [Pelagihabitans pacificus]NHF60627.1 response regulator transcription factor [Pelagihabitans pacificus]